jgi:LPXTG-motif cell wall-anchored protein
MGFKIRAAAVVAVTSLVAVPLALSGTALAQDEQPTGYIGGTVFNDYNGDGVKQDDEPGIKNVNVTVKYPDGQSHPSETDAYGNWGVKRTPHGQYEVSYVHPDFVNTTPSTVKAEVKEGDTPAVNFGVRGGSICGVAWIDANEDGQRQADEGPLANREIRLWATNRPPVRTGPDGSYCILGLPRSDHRMLAPVGANDPFVLTKAGGDSKFDPATKLSHVIRVGKGEQIKGVDAGFIMVHGDLKAVEVTISTSAGATTENTFRVGDVIEIYGSVMANGTMPERLGGVLTLPEGLRILAPAGGLGQNATVQGQQVIASFSDKKPVGLIEFLGARVVVEKEFTSAEIKFETRSVNTDVNHGNNVLTRKIDALPAQPERHHGPAVVDAQFKKTAGLANTGADPVAAGAIGLGALTLGGVALFAARRRKSA